MTRSICGRRRDWRTVADAIRKRDVGKITSAESFIPAMVEAIETQAAPLEECEGVFVHLESEARRFANFYPEASDGRNTFVIFADKIATLAKLKERRDG